MMADPRDRYLAALGIERWVLRAAAQAEPVRRANPTSPTSVPVELKSDSKVNSPAAGMDWDALQRCVADCTQCGLHASRTQTVFGVGNRSADWMVIGEAPGADEDAQGEPFVGRAGKLLNAMLLALNLPREQVYIANILKCRPPGNRDPQPEEAAQCRSYLRRQIELVAPKIILTVGRIAAQNLLQTEETIGRLRGKVHRYPEAGTPVVVTYHPAYLLRKPGDKRKAWDDLKLAHWALQQAHL
jgi:uracil-DNA glycosylase family 4